MLREAEDRREELMVSAQGAVDLLKVKLAEADARHAARESQIEEALRRAAAAEERAARAEAGVARAEARADAAEQCADRAEAVAKNLKPAAPGDALTADDRVRR